MWSYLLVFVGGGAGSVCRFGIAHALSRYPLVFPWATLLANALSCFVLGMLLGQQIKAGMAATPRFLLVVGFCGGFSTFSTFTAETLQLLQNGHPFYALSNVLFNLLVCLISIFLGIKMVG